jgi:hypothetical protein
MHRADCDWVEVSMAGLAAAWWSLGGSEIDSLGREGNQQISSILLGWANCEGMRIKQKFTLFGIYHPNNSVHYHSALFAPFDSIQWILPLHQ